jgi:small GTP-binding protein
VSSVEEQINEIVKEIRETPYNKATQLHIGRLKAKLAKLREEAERSTAKKGSGYSPKKAGDATCILVGFPSVGKSTLLNVLTNAKSLVGAYDFTTLNVIPGSMVHKGAHIQIFDVPGLVSGAGSGKGKGKEVISVIRSADLILLVIDVFSEFQIQILKEELYNAGIRLNEHPPNATIIKRAQGGITINKTLRLELDDIIIKAILREYKIHNADVILREDMPVERFIDALMTNRRYLPSITVVNKIDQLEDNLHFGDIGISAKENINIDKLKDLMFEKLAFIRIYMKPPGGGPDRVNPLILRRNATVEDVCSILHRDFCRKFKHAQIWGKSVRFPGQRVGTDHVLCDEDIVTLHIQK